MINKRVKKWCFRTALALLAFIIVAYLGISVFLGFSMTRTKRLPLEANPASLGLEYRDVSFKSTEDEILLRGWYMPVGDSEEIIIIVHGADGNRADPSIGLLDIAYGLVDHGYNVLTFDLRGHGESDGNRISAGYYEKRDLEGALGYVKSLGFEDIGVIGFSIGAVTAIYATADNEDIDAVVADSSSADLNDIIAPEFSKRTNFPRFFLPPLLFMVKIIFGVDFTAIKPVEVVADIAPRPVLFIHGKLDDTFPVEHASRLYQAADNPNSQLWIVPDAGHVRSYIEHPEEYMDRVLSFFDGALR